MNRRCLLSAVFAMLVFSGPASAQAPASPRYALMSAVGDHMTVVHARMQTGSRLDRNEHERVALPERALDRMALKHLDAALKRATPQAEVAVLTAASGRLLDLQRDALAARRPSEALAKAFADVLPKGGADRLLLIIKHRGEASIPVIDGRIGLGRLEGVGFYVDPVARLRSPTTGYIGTGFLAPFAYVRLVLADASGRVLAEREIEAAESHTIADARGALDAWNVMSAQQKIEAVDRLLQRHIDSEVPKLLATLRQ